VAADGYSSLCPHDVKHAGVAFAAEAGVDQSEIARRAGHSSVALTYERYGHLFPEIDMQAAQTLERARKGAMVRLSFGESAMGEARSDGWLRVSDEAQVPSR
jgi:hypothetical protein